MEFLLYLIMGGLIGWIAGLIVGKGTPGGVIGNVIFGIIGAWLGGELFGHFGPTLLGITVIPALIGAIIVIFVISLLSKATKKK